MEKHIIFLHGFASSANGRKPNYFRPRVAALASVTFRAFEFSPAPVDFEYLTVTGMINRLRQYILDHDIANPYLIGSSMGGLVGLNYAHRFGNVSRLLLLAPALTYLSNNKSDEWQAQGVEHLFHYGFNRLVPLRYDLEEDGRFFQTAPPPPSPITIIHGIQDEVVPITASREYATQYPEQVHLIEVEAGHDINPFLDEIWQTTHSFFQLY